MRKALIFGIALSLVLVSGGFFGAQADGCNSCLCNLSPCNWHIPSPCNWHWPSLCGCHLVSPCNWHWPSCACNVGSHDADKAH
jgi:hypothetical protein